MTIYLLSILCLVNGIYGMEHETNKLDLSKIPSLKALSLQAMCKYNINLPDFLNEIMSNETVVLDIDQNIFCIVQPLQKHVLNRARKKGATVQDKIKAFNIWNSLNTLE